MRPHLVPWSGTCGQHGETSLVDGPTGYSTMSSALPDAVNYHRWLLALVTPWLRGHGLEIGFGYGQYTRELARHVDRLLAVDVDPQCLENFRDRPDNVDLMIADLTDLEFAKRVGVASFDAIVCLNVLEHIDDDMLVLRQFREALRPGGRVCLIIPAHAGLYGPMDAMAGHFRRYSRPDFRERLVRAGYRVRELSYINPLGALGWWVNAKVLKPKDLSAPLVNRQILLYDRYVQPVSEWLNPVTTRFFGQSLWAVGERPAED